MKNQKTGLGQKVHFYGSVDEMQAQFQEDVDHLGREFLPVLSKFDLGNIYDQSVLGTILTLFTAVLTVAAERSDPHFKDTLLKDFESQVKYLRTIQDKLFYYGK